MSGPVAWLLNGSVALILTGLGAGLVVDDFVRLRAHGLRFVLLLGVMVVGMPAVAFGLGRVLGLEAAFVMGLVVLAAAPAGPLSSAFTGLARGDVAQAVMLVASSTLVSLVSMPLVLRLASQSQVEGAVPVELLLFMVALVLVPVSTGMFVRRRSVAVAERIASIAKTLAIVVLAAAIVLVVIAQREKLLEALPKVGVAVVVLNLLQLGVGFLVGGRTVGPALSFGVRNGSIALAVAGAPALALDSAALLPIAVYAGVQSVTTALIIGWRRRVTS